MAGTYTQKRLTDAEKKRVAEVVGLGALVGRGGAKRQRRSVRGDLA